MKFNLVGIPFAATWPPRYFIDQTSYPLYSTKESPTLEKIHYCHFYAVSKLLAKHIAACPVLCSAHATHNVHMLLTMHGNRSGTRKQTLPAVNWMDCR
jgi:hypothetical protein